MTKYREWKPASGYRSQSGKSMWRVVRDHADNSMRFQQLKTATGKLALFRSLEAAQRRAAKLNDSISGVWERGPYVGGNPTRAEKLVSAYRFHRARQRPSGLHCPAAAAYGFALNDVSTGKERYSVPSGYGPAFKARGTSHMRFIERPSTCGLRFVGYADKLAGLDHTGWYVDNDQNETVRGVVFQLPGRNGKPLFICGYEDWNNGKADSDGPVCLDFGDVLEGEAREWIPARDGWSGYWSYSDDPRDHDGCREAARAADQTAEWLAESEREYRAAWGAGSRYHDLGEEIAASRHTVKALLAERKAARAAKLLTYPTICETIRRAVSNALGDIETARAERHKLASGDYVDDWLPGWNSNDSHLVAAFKEGACV